MYRLAAVCLVILCLANTQAQTVGLPEKALIMKVGGSGMAGIGDLGKRFPIFSTLPAELYLKTPKKYCFGISYQPFLGNRVKVDSLYGGIVGKSEIIFDQNGFPGLIRYYMRGFALQATMSKILPFKPTWPHSGIEVRMGVGLMQHYIKARFDAGSIPQLSDDYRLGYDRLSNGIMFSETVNFHYLNTETVSFFAGFTFGQGFTKNRRNWDYSTMKQDLTLRKDLYLGISAGVLIPIVLKSGQTAEYYN